MVYAKFGGQTECIMGNWKIENSSISPEALTYFDEKLVTFFLKLVLPVILKEMQSNFLISTSRLLQKLSHK